MSINSVKYVLKSFLHFITISKFILLFLFFSSLINICLSQQYNFKTYSLEDGLAQSVVNKIYQDSRGYLWFATGDGGISKFNGKTFVNYGTKDSLINNTVTCIVEDKIGNIWIGTHRGISLFDGDKFTNFRPNDSLPIEYVFCCLKDTKGDLWFGTIKGIVKVTFKKDNSYSLSVFKSNKNLINKWVYSIYQDKKGNIWFGTVNNGLYKYNDNKFIRYTTKDGLTDNSIASILEDKAGNLWIGTKMGLNKLIPEDETNYKFINVNKKDGFSDVTVSSILEDKSGSIWIGTMGDGVFKYDGENYIHYTEKEGLSKNYINCIFEDNTNNLWIGTYSGGVVKYDKGIFSYLSAKDGLSYNIVFSFMKDKKDNMWIGTYGGGLNKYDGKKFEIYNQAKGLDENRIFAMIKDSFENIWVSTGLGGLHKIVYDHSKDSYPKIIKFDEYPKEKGISVCVSMEEDKNGNIWMGTIKSGAYLFNPYRKGKIEFKNFSDKEGFISSIIYSIHCDISGNLWFTSNRNGIYKISKEQFYNKENRDFKFINYTIDDGLVSNEMSVICEEKDGTLWFASSTGGISRYDGKSFTNYTTKDGLHTGKIFSMVVDNQNNLWIGYVDGVDKITLNKSNKYAKHPNYIKRIKHYGVSEGFRSLECNQNAIIVDKIGRVWFGTIGGVNIYNPNINEIDNVEAKTHITGIKLFNKDVNWKDYTDSLTSWFKLPYNLKLPYNKNNISFDFIGLNYTAPEGIEYKFILEGFDKEWSPVTHRTQASYTNLPHGKYTFKVKASNGNGFWNERSVEFSFEILPPYWKTWWFYTITVLTLLFVIYIFFKIQERNLINKNLALEKAVKNRTLELYKEKEIVEKKSIQIEYQKSLLEKKNEAIIDSINYAERIQTAILPSKEFVKKLFPDSFVLDEPKDIVSGEFYWMYEKGNKVFFAVADCTGHGVPGAFMSIIGSNILNQVVKEEHITDPNLILNSISKAIKKMLGNSSDKSSIKDGINIALCIFDKENNSLLFAGAYHPLYLIRNKELIEIKGNRIPIAVGGYDDDGEKFFTNHVVEIQKGDIIYLFSDGYVDQVGGPKRKKFYYGKFKETLLSINHLSMDEQKEKLHKIIIDWQQDYDRFDDILILGIRF